MPITTEVDLKDYDWISAFQEANVDIRRAHPTDTNVSVNPINPGDVETVLAWDEGYNDGPDWLLMGIAQDGRAFLVSAGCDYTGWDCQASGTLTVAANPIQLMAFGMTTEQSNRLRLR
jgi:hypothetical protein